MLGLLGNIPLLVPLLACVYAFGFGILETFGFPSRTPSLTWQVPSGWINGRPPALQTLIWGTILGTGLVTRNPYAGMWLLPLLVALNHSLLLAICVSIAIGFAHGSARAFGVLSNLRYMNTSCGDILILGSRLRWQFMDGLTLLLASGALTVYTLSLLGIHP